VDPLDEQAAIATLMGWARANGWIIDDEASLAGDGGSTPLMKSVHSAETSATNFTGA
jgi:hypothetical protein